MVGRADILDGDSVPGKPIPQHLEQLPFAVEPFLDFARVNEVYGKCFPNNPPARETVEVSRLPKDVNVEISCIAIK